MQLSGYAELAQSGTQGKPPEQTVVSMPTSIAQPAPPSSLATGASGTTHGGAIAASGTGQSAGHVHAFSYASQMPSPQRVQTATCDCTPPCPQYASGSIAPHDPSPHGGDGDSARIAVRPAQQGWSGAGTLSTSTPAPSFPISRSAS